MRADRWADIHHTIASAASALRAPTLGRRMARYRADRESRFRGSALPATTTAPTRRSTQADWLALDSCGCAMGAWFLAATTIATAAWYAWHAATAPLPLGNVALRMLGIAFTSALTGKVTGIALYRLRNRRGAMPPLEARSSFHTPSVERPERSV